MPKIDLDTKFLAPQAIEADVKEGTIKGYAAIFGNIDDGGDILQADAIDPHITATSVKMLWQHDPYTPIGVWDVVRPDEKGLYVEGRLLEDVQQAKEAAALIRAGAVSGLSIGYRTVRAERIDDVRHLMEIEMWEVSVVTFPMNTDARIDAVKAAEMSDRDIERKLTRDAGFSRSAAQALMRGGCTELRTKRDAGQSEAVAMLQSIKQAFSK